LVLVDYQGSVVADQGESPPATTEVPALELRNVTAGYGATTVLRQVSITVPVSRVVAVIGPNGAGKTTLLNTASGLLRPSVGSVLLGGRDVTNLSSFELARQGVCLVPEGRGVFPSLSVRENLVLQSPKGQESATMDMVAAAFPVLGTRMGQIAGSLSGGEQQMLAISRAYVSNPRVVMVDEASLGLSPIVVDQLFAFLQQIAQTGVSLVLVEQYVTRALAMADEVYLLNRGAVAYSGPTSALRGQEMQIFARYLGLDTPNADAHATAKEG
jgi:branched-chain amino acid transport system ATP-binding protein